MRISAELERVLSQASADSLSSVLSTLHRVENRDWKLSEAASIHFLRNLTLEGIEPFLKYHLYRAALQPRISFGGFNTPRQDLLNPEWESRRTQTDLLVLALTLEEFAPSSRLPGWDAHQTGRELRELFELAHHHSGSLLAINTFICPLYSFGNLAPNGSDLSQRIRQLNDSVREFAASRPGEIVLVDWDRLARILGERQTFDRRYAYLARAPFRPPFLNLYAQELARAVAALKGHAKKALVLDCDNTLWGGVVGEDGLEGIQLHPAEHPGSAYYDFQAALLQLAARGVLLALCSRNNEAEIWEVLAQHPHCLLKREHFASFRIGWEDKAEYLVSLARELRLGLDSLVFVDDNPAECDRIRRALPEVAVVSVPTERSELPHLLAKEGWFESLAVSAEDAARSTMIGQDLVRRSAPEESLQEYLLSLQQVAKVHRVRAEEVPRVAQLTQKTNQFNLTTRRYSAAQITTWADDPNTAVFTLSASDRHGDLGLTGVLIARREGTIARIDSLLMSCRVLGRDLEIAFVEYCLKELSTSWNPGLFRAEYIPTAKNGQVAGFWEKEGFLRTTKRDETAFFELVPAGRRWKSPTFIRVVED